MDIVADHKQISNEDKDQIKRQVKAELIDHLYQGCLPGTITGLVVSVFLFLDYFRQSPLYLLVGWLTFFNVMMVAFSGLYFLYTKYKISLSLIAWEWAYSIMMSMCALAWVPGIYLLPQDHTRQSIALLAIFMATTGYSVGTIGEFFLCVVTINLILIPLIIWCLVQGGIFYNIIAIFTLIYMGYMVGINHRSTRWFIASLKLKLENTLVSYQANHDLLTDLPNARMLPPYIESAIHFAQDSQASFALIAFSLNRMEMISDSFGHQANDLIIRGVAERLRTFSAQLSSVINNSQCIITISRKDTFNIILAPLKPEEAEAKIRTLFSILEDPFYLQDRIIKVTASLGVSLFPRDGENTKSLLANADAAMLRAKQYGGNRLEFYKAEINAELPRQIEIENDLYDALKNNQLQVYYQPLVDLKTGQIAGSEALLRWIHPVHGFISPAQFIPVAEETGLIIPIGEWVLKEACKQTKIWQEMGFSSLRVAVNLSGKQLQEENIIEVIERALKDTEYNPKLLELELTETAILDEKVVHIIQEFKRLGLSLAVDDFGTGYSGLSYLKRFSIDKLKIDQSFIRDIPGNDDSITIVSAILAMAKELGIASLAEGVENKEQLLFLKGKGCDYIQGYYFSKPIEGSFFTQLLLNYRNLPVYMNLE